MRTSCWLMIMLMTMTTMAMVTIPHSDTELLSVMFSESRLENRTRWEALQLQAIHNPIKERDVYLSHLWEQYKNPSMSTTAKEILDAVTNIAYLDSRIDMIGFLLFGPRKGWPVVRAVTNKNLTADSPGFKYMLKFFEKHCGVVTDHGMKQSLANIHKYAIDKQAIHEAIILACSRHNKTKTYGIDVNNPKINITPAPVHGTFEYCSRVSVSAVTNNVKPHQITVVPSAFIPDAWHSMIHICYHKNDSLELCQCEKDDWRSIQKGSWSSFMPPYDQQRFVDVKFVAQIPDDFVTVTLDEVPPTWRFHYGLFAGAIALIIMVRASSQKKLWPLGQAASMMTCGLMSLLILVPVMVRITFVSEQVLLRSSQKSGTRWEPLKITTNQIHNGTRWGPLETTANQIHIEDELMVREREFYRYDLWNRYTSSSRSQRPEIVKEISESFKQVAFRDARLDMVGLILFGQGKGRLFLRTSHDKIPHLVDVLDHLECARTIDGLYRKHCGLLCFNGLRHKRSLSNLCYLATKEAIEEAIIYSCGMNVIIDPVQR